MSELSQIRCIHPQQGEPPLSEAELAAFHPLVPSWRIVRDDGVRKLRNEYSFDGGEDLRRFVKRLMTIADAENHHPKIDEDGTKAAVDWWTHSIGDLHPNDFLMAAKTDGVYSLIVVGAEGDMTTGESLPTLRDIPKFQEVVAGRYPLLKDTEE